MEILLSIDGIIALLTLTFLEIILGVDNIIFISIVSNKLPDHQQGKARTIGLTLALVLRILMLLGISWIIGLEKSIIGPYEITESLILDFSGKDIILFIGGLFLLAKSTTEIHHKIDHLEKKEETKSNKKAVLSTIITQIVFLDVIFSIDSILTAVGLTEHVSLMIIAVIISMGVMLAFSGKISAFINKHPSLQLLALTFLILIGFTLIMESFGQHVPKGYIYFAVFFSLTVEVLNIKMRNKSKSNA
mgnify:CR=1 FL=1